jgi:hypothetical protein
MQHRAIVMTVTIAASLAVVAADRATAQTWAGTGRVKGVVTDVNGDAVAGARVTYRMVQDRDVGPEPFVTDDRGRYSFRGLLGGLWFVRAEADGFDPWEGTSEVSASGAPEPLEITLEASSETEPADEGVSAEGGDSNPGRTASGPRGT